MRPDVGRLACLLAGLLLPVLLLPVAGNSQIIIRERMELGERPDSLVQAGIDEPAEDSPPFWFPLEANRFLMLKSGVLTLRFDRATLLHTPLQPDDSLGVQINTQQGLQFPGAPALDHLPEPMHVNAPGCTQERFLYTPDTTRVAVGVTDGAGKDAYVISSTPARTTGLDSTLIIGQTTDQATGEVTDFETFMAFDLSGFRSPVSVVAADLALQPINTGVALNGTFTFRPGRLGLVGQASGFGLRDDHLGRADASGLPGLVF